MKVQRVVMITSSVLLTIGLLALAPVSLRYASTWQQTAIQVAERTWEQNYLMPIGFSSLALILIGIIVIWTGYIKGLRGTWFVMFVIVWVFAFPVHMLPVLLDSHWFTQTNWSKWFMDTISGNSVARAYAYEVLDFLLLAIALFLPVTWFFRRHDAKPKSTHAK